MHKSKKAQISDTISWIVATIIIVLILSIPILLVELGVIKRGVYFYRMYDPIATKSISGYLLQNYDKTIEPNLGNKEAPSVRGSIDSFLTTLARDEKEGWGVKILIKNELFYEKTPSGLVSLIQIGKGKRAINDFYFKENFGEALIEFWMESERGALD
ncbi:MAG: hypothetical protein ABIH28_02865 [archaeon]